MKKSRWTPRQVDYYLKRGVAPIDFTYNRGSLARDLRDAARIFDYLRTHHPGVLEEATGRRWR